MKLECFQPFVSKRWLVHTPQMTVVQRAVKSKVSISILTKLRLDFNIFYGRPKCNDVGTADGAADGAAYGAAYGASSVAAYANKAQGKCSTGRDIGCRPAIPVVP